MPEETTQARQIADATYDPELELRRCYDDGSHEHAPLAQAEFAAAFIAGRAEAETELRARSVRYVADQDMIELVTTNHAGFLIPRRWIGALDGVPVEELVALEVWPDGSAIELESQDIQISVDGLMTAVLPAMVPARTVAAIFTSRGGKANSIAKQRSADYGACRGEGKRLSWLRGALRTGP